MNLILILTPSVGRKTAFPKTRCIAMSYARLLLDNTALKAHMYHMRLTETNVCECGQAAEDPYHFLLRRVCYHQLRKNIVDTVQQACIEDSNGRTPELSVAISYHHVQVAMSARLEDLKFCWLCSTTYRNPVVVCDFWRSPVTKLI